MDFWANVVAGFAAGISATMVWVGIVYLTNRVKSRRIEKAISKSLLPAGINYHVSGIVGIGIKNETLNTVIIRKVFLSGGDNGNFTIDFGLHPDSSMKGVKQNDYGWVELPPQTQGVWGFPFAARPVGTMFLPVKELSITYEFKTLLGSTKINTIHPVPFHKEYMLKAFTDAIEGKYPPRQASPPNVAFPPFGRKASESGE